MAATNFPFNLTTLANLKNSSGAIPRFNLKNDGTYFTASSLATASGPIYYEGYSSSVGDGGRATIDASGTATAFWSIGQNSTLIDIIIQNNGSSGSNDGFVGSNQNITFIRCVANNIRGAGFNTGNSTTTYIECEAYACNKSNTDGKGGFVLTSGHVAINCISHDNTGSNNDGFFISSGASCVSFTNCISESNGRHGFSGQHTFGLYLIQCDAYNNGGDGYRNSNTTVVSASAVRNCNFIKNTGWGINSTITTARWWGSIENCGFGAGTQVNGSGSTNGTDAILITGSVTYANDVTPWVDPANGDFRVNLRAATGTGRGAFTQTQASYGSASMLAYPDIGSVQHRDFQKSSVSSG